MFGTVVEAISERPPLCVKLEQHNLTSNFLNLLAMEGNTPADAEGPLQVAESSLSSSEDRSPSPENSTSEPVQFGADRRSRIDASPDLDDDDDVIIEEDDEDEEDAVRPMPAVNGSRASDADSSSHSSARLDRDDSSDDDAPRTSARSRDKGISSAENSGVDLPSDHSEQEEPTRNTRKSRKQYPDGDSDYNQSDDDDVSDGSDELSDEEGKGKSTGRRPQPSRKLVIPDELREDNQYFRRSSRPRNAPNRLAGSPNVSDSSDGAADSDSDFEAHDGK